MSVLEIRRFPDPVLKKKAEPVETVDEEIRKLMDEMAETMYASFGIGLAAPQVGVSKRVIVVDVSPRDETREGRLIALANPHIVKSEGSEEFEEGCLSLPGFTTVVERPSKITLSAIDREGRDVLIEADGILAIALQHEMDHLEGTLILDHASTLKREFYKKRIKKQAVANS